MNTGTQQTIAATQAGTYQPPRAPARIQGGFALVMVLMLLIAATLLALMSVHQSAGQEHLSANQRAWSMAFAGAEFASRSAERWLLEHAANSGGASLVATASIGGSIYGSADSGNTNLVEFSKPRVWHTAGARAVTEHNFLDGEATGRLAAQPVYMIQDLGKVRPPGTGTIGEGGVTGNSGYEGSAGMSPAGNSDLRVYRTIGKSLGPGADPGSSFVVTVWSIFAGRTHG